MSREFVCINYMKTTNKAFTIIELLVVVAIAAIIAGMAISHLMTIDGIFGKLLKLLMWAVVYFSIPGIIFGGLLKLNQKYRWVVKGKYDRYIANFKDGEYMDNDMVNIHLNAYFIIWPFYIPCFIAWIGGKELYHRYIKTMLYNVSKKKGGFFSIPKFGDDKE